MGDGAHGSGNLSVTDLLLRGVETNQATSERGPVDHQLQTEGCRFGVDAVAASDHDRVLMFLRLGFDAVQELDQRSAEYGSRLLDLQGQRGVQKIAAGHALVHETAGRPDVLGHVGQKGDHIVLDRFFDLENTGGVEVAFGPYFPGCLGGDLPPVGADLTDHGFDFPPDAEAVLIGPDGGHFRAGVTGDHGIPSWPKKLAGRRAWWGPDHHKLIAGPADGQGPAAGWAIFAGFGHLI